jgi:hypothetical protein
MTTFQRLTILRARYHVEWLLLLNGSTHGLHGWLDLIERLHREGRPCSA